MSTCAGCGEPVGVGATYCGSCGRRQRGVPPGPNVPAPAPRSGALHGRWRLWARAGLGILAAGIVIVAVVELTGGGGAVNGLAASYSCTSTEAPLQGTHIAFTDRGNALGRGLGGSIDLPGGSALAFSDGDVNRPPPGERDRIISFGNLQVGSSVDLSAVAQLSPNGDIVWGDFLTCAP